jgi:hypothetical protein
MANHRERAEQIAAKALRSASRALDGAQDHLADDHALTLELLTAATTAIELARTAIGETAAPDTP